MALTVQYENYTDGRETAYLKFCDGVDSLDQLGRPHGEPECPPKKGWGLMMMTGWVWPMFIYEVSRSAGMRIESLDKSQPYHSLGIMVF